MFDLYKLRTEKYASKCVVNLPKIDGYKLPFDYSTHYTEGEFDMILIFVFTIDECLQHLKVIINKHSLRPEGVLFFAYPKKGNKVYDCYIGRDDFFPTICPDAGGYVPHSTLKFNKMVSLNEVFTIIGLKHPETQSITTCQSVCG